MEADAASWVVIDTIQFQPPFIQALALQTHEWPDLSVGPFVNDANAK